MPACGRERGSAARRSCRSRITTCRVLRASRRAACPTRQGDDPHRRRLLHGRRSRPAGRTRARCRRIRRLADGGRRPWHRRRRQWTRFDLRRLAACRCAVADGHAVEGDRRLWRLSLRLGGGHRPGEEPRPHLRLFDRPAARRSWRRPSRRSISSPPIRDHAALPLRKAKDFTRRAGLAGGREARSSR